MKYETIINKITSGLTGNPEQDLPYLQKKAEKYKNHTLSKEILRAIGRLIYEVLPEEKKQEWVQAMNKEHLGIATVLQEAQFQIFRKEYDRALDLLEGIVAKIEEPKGRFENDNVSEYFSFENLLEEILYQELHKPKRDIRRVPENYAEIYYIYGNLLFEMEKYEEAETALLKASRWNPVSVEPMFELGEIYKKNRQYATYVEISKKCLERAYKSQHLARGYRNLGYYYIEEKNFEMATALYFFSMEFDQENKTAQSELLYISHLTGQQVSQPTIERFQALFEKEGIQFGPNPLILDIAVFLGHEAKKANEYDSARFFFSIAYDLTGNEQIKIWLDDIPVSDG